MGLLLDHATNPPKMPPECIRGIVGTPRQVVVEGGLPAKRLARADPASLLALGLPDLLCRHQHLFDTTGTDEHDAILVGKHQVASTDEMHPEPRRGQGLGLLLIESHWAGRVAAIAEHRKPDLCQLRRVAMQTPHHKTDPIA